MRLKVSLEVPRSGKHDRGGAGSVLDISITCDATTTVEEVAYAILAGEVRGAGADGAGADVAGADGAAAEGVTANAVSADGDLGNAAHGRLTLVASANREEELVLDPLTPLIHSGVQSGWWIRLARELATGVPRARPLMGIVEVCGGQQRGARFTLVPGRNTIGRGRRNRVPLWDASVSRSHALIEVTETMVLRDLGSANGIAACGERGSQRISEVPITHRTTLRLGAVLLRVIPVAACRAGAGHDGHLDSNASEHPFAHEQQHIRPPRVEPRVHEITRDLPAPPEHAEPQRVPLVAMLTPMLMGAGMYAITQSPMSLIMVAFSPVMMAGSWLDTRLRARGRSAHKHTEFARALAAERAALTELSTRESTIRLAVHPSTRDIAEAIRNRSDLLWARRPDHGEFLTLRLGVGVLPSHTRVVLPERGSASSEDWAALLEAKQEFEHVHGVPVVARLQECGALGVVGSGALAAGTMRALVLQLVGLHAPGEVALAAFAPTDDFRHDDSNHDDSNHDDWGWLRWLPHIEGLPLPTGAWPLAAGRNGAAKLVAVLEEIAADRGRGQPAAQETIPPTRIVVLVHEASVSSEHRAKLLRLAAAGPSCGIHLIWLACSATQLPAACRVFINIGPGNETSGVHSVTEGTVVELERAELLDLETAIALARSLAPIADAALGTRDDSELPGSVPLRELLPVDVLGGPEAILTQWREAGSLIREWELGVERAPISLEAVVGQGSLGPVRLDLRVQGPHALIGGTTGSGKSEFLQSWIMSLASGLSPDRLTFLLVDYKGGAAFAECAELPHTVGLITDLTPHLVRRALTSLRAELRRREELLAACEAKDLMTLEQRSDPRAPPVLVIVIDEFAALAREMPEFLEGVLDIAQRGRSLGLHLIMATQRPAGVVTDNIRANTNMRIALRMSDAADSRDVLGTADAAHFSVDTPGRAALAVGAKPPTHFQTGYLGVRGREREKSGITICDLSTIGEWEWSAARRSSGRLDTVTGTARQQPQRDIEALRDALAAAALLGEIPEPRRPWLDPLPGLLSLDALVALSRCSDMPEQVGVLAGLRDAPAAQRQVPLAIDLDVVGNVAVFGAGGAGKTSALLMLAASASAAAYGCLRPGAGAAGEQPRASPIEGATHLYAVDAAGGSLESINALPNVGGVARAGDRELIERIVRDLHERVVERGVRYAAAGAGTLTEYRALARRLDEPRILFLIDGFGALTHELERYEDRGDTVRRLGEIMRSGRAVGVHTVLATERPAELSSALASSVQLRLVLRLGDTLDYAHAGLPAGFHADALERGLAGRAILIGTGTAASVNGASGSTSGSAPGNVPGNGSEVQLAHLGEDASLVAQTAALDALARRIREGDFPPPRCVLRAPTDVALSSLPGFSEGRAVFGVQAETLDAVEIPRTGLAVIAGPPGSGLSSAALSCVAALHKSSVATGASVMCVLLSLGRKDDGSALSRWRWDQSGYGDEEVVALAERLSGDSDGLLTHAGQRAVVVVERATEARDRGTIDALIELAWVARRGNALVVFEYGSGSGIGAWELTAALKQPSWGLLLQPDDADNPSIFSEQLGRARRADFPPGRGFMLERGRVIPLQVALPETPSEKARADAQPVPWRLQPSPHLDQ